jgi:hypothetical protein
MIDDALPGRELEEILDLSRDTFRHWAFEGLLHPVKRVYRGKTENLYLVAEIRDLLIGKGYLKRVAILDDARGEKHVESEVEVANRPPAAADPPARSPVMGPRAMKRAQEELGCQKAVVSLLWVTGFAVMALVVAIARVKGLW